MLLACAFLSVVTDAHYLNQTLEFQLSFKKLPLLVSYVSIFVIASSAVRRSEVRPFMTYTLVLAVIVAVGDDRRVPDNLQRVLDAVGEAPAWRL